MKAITLVVCAILMFGVAATAQDKVTESAVLGTWRMVIEDLEDTKEEFKDKGHKDEEDMDASERLEHAIESAVSEFVSEMVGGIDIRFTFMSGNKARMEVDVMGEHEVENLKWYINDDGGLVLEEKERNHDEAWYLEGDRLVQYDRKGKRDSDAYMVRVN